MGVVARGRLELLAELAVPQLGTGGDAVGAKQRRDPEPLGGRLGIRAHDHRGGAIHARDGETARSLIPQRQDQPIQPDPEADGRGGAAAQQLHQAVVPPTAADRLLLALAALDIELERRARVVVEPADEARLETVGHAQRIEMRPDGGEMGRAGVAQAIGDARRPGVDRRHGHVVRVQEPQHVPLQPVALELGQLVDPPAVVRRQLLDIGGAAGRVADRVEEHLDAAQACIGVEPRRQLDDLGIHGRTRIADGLDVELPELAVAAGLWAVVPEHRADLVDPDGLRPRLHPVLDICAHDPCRRLRPERPRFGLLAARDDPEQLLLDDVGHLADAALEHRHLFEHRRLDAAVAVARREVGGEALEAGPDRGLVGQQVARASGGSEDGHRPKSRSSKGGRTGYPRSRWTLITSLRFSMRLMTLASCDTDATCRVAVTTAVWSWLTPTLAATMLTLFSATTCVMSLSKPVRS
jgi:hypothetical protein